MIFTLFRIYVRLCFSIWGLVDLQLSEILDVLLAVLFEL